MARGDVVLDLEKALFVLQKKDKETGDTRLGTGDTRLESQWEQTRGTRHEKAGILSRPKAVSKRSPELVEEGTKGSRRQEAGDSRQRHIAYAHAFADARWLFVPWALYTLFTAMLFHTELRYRQRYVDLVVNTKVRETFLKRTKLMNSIREFLNEKGALEVDTPVLQSIPGGAAAKPFITHHNALDIPLYLRIANELYLKRLIVGGFDWVYEFSRNFRNEGMDKTHNPEFTVLEFYVAYKDYFWMMETTEQLLEKAALDTNGDTFVQVGDNMINFKAPFKRISIYEAIKTYTGFDVSNMDETALRDVCNQLKIEVDNTMGKGKLIDAIFGNRCEHNYIQPTFIIDYPVEMSPLTKKHRTKEGLVERFELMINGKEIANAYSELNDPIDQRERFEEQLKLMERGDNEAMFIDHDFLRALEYGMPPTSGIGFGIDRLTMLLTNQASIQEVLFFPQMRPEK